MSEHLASSRRPQTTENRWAKTRDWRTRTPRRLSFSCWEHLRHLKNTFLRCAALCMPANAAKTCYVRLLCRCSSAKPVLFCAVLCSAQHTDSPRRRSSLVTQINIFAALPGTHTCIASALLPVHYCQRSDALPMPALAQRCIAGDLCVGSVRIITGSYNRIRITGNMTAEKDASAGQRVSLERPRAALSSIE